MVTWVNDGAVDPPLRTATITVTFEPPPQPIPTTTAAPPVEVTPTLTG
jgi:hypothetical protein